MEKITATAAQCRRALARIPSGATPTLKVCGLALLAVLAEDGEPCPAWDEAPDYEAGALMRTYAAANIAVRRAKPGRRIADHVRFCEKGIV